MDADGVQPDRESNSASTSEADSDRLIPPSTEGTPSEIWDEFFSRQQVPPSLVRELIQKLHSAGKDEHVVAALEAAISSGQIQSWMYEVLAVTMESLHRPKEEVDRVLLSGLDLGARDYESTIYLAAYLVRFNRLERALALYREASANDPERSEPYILGLRLARLLKDPAGIEWGVSGVLKYAWGKDYERQQQEARHASADAIKILKDRGELERAAGFQSTIDEASKRDLLIRVEWNGAGDLDLLVAEPSGAKCDAEHPTTSTGGRFLHDGFGLESSEENKYDSYLCREGESGEYVITVRHIRGKVVANKAILTVITHQGTASESVRKMTMTVGPDQDATKSIHLEGGRLVRKESGDIP